MDDHLPSDTSPAERRRLKVRASILDAAERVFAAEGSDGLSIRRLAEEIDYSPAAIYKYFASKDELIDELQEDFFAQLLGQVDSVQLTNGPYLDRARACMRTYIETALARPQHYMAAFADVHAEMPDAADPEPVPEDSAKHRAFGYLSGMVAEGQQLGVIRQDVSNVALAMSIWAACHGAASLIAHMPDFPEKKPVPSGLTLDAFLDLHAGILLQGALTPGRDQIQHAYPPENTARTPRKTQP